MMVRAFTDGASRGNPGESGVGIILKDEHGNEISSTYGYIGKATNNVSEYRALLACLTLVEKVACDHLVVHSDSELMVRQLTGKYKVKDPTLKQYVARVRERLKNTSFKFEIIHVLREENSEADELANRGIDSRAPLKL
ncbi:MAG: ribonuclease HI family protein [Bacteroidota bacterium]